MGKALAWAVASLVVCTVAGAGVPASLVITVIATVIGGTR